MKSKNIRQCIIAIACIALAIAASGVFSFRIDLTAEKRYTLAPETKKILREIDAPIYVEVYLDGDLPTGFRKLRDGTTDMLDEMKRYAAQSIVYQLIDPSKEDSTGQREQRYAYLREKGLREVNVNKKNKDGSLSQQMLFPGAVLSYKNREISINLLSNNRVQSSDVVLNASLEALQYELIHAIHTLQTDSISRVAFLSGQGELNRAEVFDLGMELANYYNVDFKTINGKPDALDNYSAIIIAKPAKPFDERDKYIIDRYIMSGGKVLWLLDGVEVNTDSLTSMGLTFALAASLNLEDQLFTYGVRINSYLVQDIVNNPIVVTTDGGKPTPAPWVYYPLAAPAANHPITRYVNPVWLRYASNIDFVGRDSSVSKTPLLLTSDYSRLKATPAMIYLSEVSQPLDAQQFRNHGIVCAALLEGRFPSVYRSRNARHLFPDLAVPQLRESAPTKMVIVADGDVAANDVRQTPQGLTPWQPLGFDRYSRQTFGNKDFLVNALSYLTDDAGLMQLRGREFRLRLLNKQKINRDLLFWQLMNVVAPVALAVGGGLVYVQWRKRRYGRKAVSKI